MGDEIGAEFEPYQDPPPISWDDPHGLAPLYKNLAELREELSALHSGKQAAIKLDSDAAYAFSRDAGEATSRSSSRTSVQKRSSSSSSRRSCARWPNKG